MKDTGERHILNENFRDKSELYIHLMHIATYEYAKNFASGKKVLDFGCGSGYGAKILSEKADSVTGTDLSQEAVDFAKDKYNSDNLNFITDQELADKKFDMITSFQVIEHVENDAEYITRLKGLLNPGGLLLISTPDKKNRLFNYIQKPWNIFHLKEYTSGSLKKLLENHFTQVEILKIGSGSDLVLEEISRTKKQRIITLPCTLSLYPYSLRVFLLKFQKSIFESLKKIKSGSGKMPAGMNGATADFHSGYSHNDITIGKEIQYSTDLLAVCIKNSD
ncbi:class I SAM-dependent methyltransferase [Chryseobacterium gossypii]|uniref:class I SAM-dependent methyltransferase n=1 Tax=Chryseobacterium gossypii TaxID=3231602 RepID=UPI0035233D0A